MATQHQIDANRVNAAHSTGPCTESGKQTSSQNHLTLGLYTRTDYVKPEERDFYKEFAETMYSELSPAGMLEDTLASEIVGASWRLRRCSAVEADLFDYLTQDPLLDDKTEKNRRSIDRARASAHSHFHRAINQLRKLQTEREIRFELLGEDKPGLADCKKVAAARRQQQKSLKSTAASREDAFMQRVMAFCEPDPTVMKKIDKELMAKYCPELRNAGQDLSPQVPNEDATPSASICNSGQDSSPQASNEDALPSSLASNCTAANQNPAELEIDDAFLALDEESQLRILIEQEQIDNAALEEILKAA